MGRGSDTYAMDQQISQGLQSPVVGVFHCRSILQVSAVNALMGDMRFLILILSQSGLTAKMTEAEQQQNKEGENGWVQIRET